MNSESSFNPLLKEDSEIYTIRIDSLNAESNFYIISEGKRSLELASEAYELSLKHGYEKGKADSSYILGILYKESDLTQSINYFLIANDYYEKNNNYSLIFDILRHLGHSYLNLGQFPLAELYLSKALDLASKQSLPLLGNVLNLLAGVYYYTGRSFLAEKCLMEAMEVSKNSSDLTEQIKNTINLGVLLTGLGRYSEALELLINAHNSSKTTNMENSVLSKLLINIGHIYLEMNEPENSSIFLELALKNAISSGDFIGEANSTLNLAVRQQKISDLDSSEVLYRKSLFLSREVDYKQGEISSLDGLGNLLVQRGEFALGIAALCEALTIAQSLEDLEGELDILMHLGQAHAQRQVWPDALEVLSQALERATQAGRPKAVTEAHSSLYEVYKGMNDLEKALHHHELLYTTERALMSEESEKRVQELSARFNLERSQQEAQLERLLRETAEEARNRALEQVQQRTEELVQAQLEVVNRLAVAAEYRDDLTGEHTRRVGHYAARIAEKLGLDPLTVSTLETAARLHDVGKIGIPDDILHKPGTLLPEEFEFMKSHTRMGARILSGGQSLLLRMAEEISLTHHERWDGTGYPEGLAGDAIPLLGRIVAAADVFDALTHERSYKQAWTPQEALGELERSSGAHFDPQVVKAALEVLREIPG